MNVSEQGPSLRSLKRRRKKTEARGRGYLSKSFVEGWRWEDEAICDLWLLSFQWRTKDRGEPRQLEGDGQDTAAKQGVWAQVLPEKPLTHSDAFHFTKPPSYLVSTITSENRQSRYS